MESEEMTESSNCTCWLTPPVLALLSELPAKTERQKNVAKRSEEHRKLRRKGKIMNYEL